VIALLQRVAWARVEIKSVAIAAIDKGILALVAIERGDGEPQIERLLERILTYRMFADLKHRMNLSLQDTRGELLLVPQFTLAADTHTGTRPSFAAAAPPEHGALLFDCLVEAARKRYGQVQTGQFGAHMQVHLCNDGPVTFWLRAVPDDIA
jgi:D-aminoacyl-tRNA deacylase